MREDRGRALLCHLAHPLRDRSPSASQDAGGVPAPGGVPFSHSKGIAMHIRPLEVEDHPASLRLLIETFSPFFEDYVRPLLGEQVFEHQHGHWEDDYRGELPTLHAPESGRHAVVAHLADGTITGLVSWKFGGKPDHGEISLLAISALHRRQHIGRRLCQHAIAHMRAGGVHVVEIGTGGDPFHAPARELYEGLGLTRIPVAVYLGTIRP
ncbi:MAG: GNAT family N-acetyltransferase [Acidimicrobiales bacterium]